MFWKVHHFGYMQLVKIRLAYTLLMLLFAVWNVKKLHNGGLCFDWVDLKGLLETLLVTYVQRCIFSGATLTLINFNAFDIYSSITEQKNLSVAMGWVLMLIMPLVKFWKLMTLGQVWNFKMNLKNRQMWEFQDELEKERTPHKSNLRKGTKSQKLHCKLVVLYRCHWRKRKKKESVRVREKAKVEILPAVAQVVLHGFLPFCLLI